MSYFEKICVKSSDRKSLLGVYFEELSCVYAYTMRFLNNTGKMFLVIINIAIHKTCYFSIIHMCNRNWISELANSYKQVNFIVKVSGFNEFYWKNGWNANLQLSGGSWKLLLDGPSFHDLQYFIQITKVNFFPAKFFFCSEIFYISKIPKEKKLAKKKFTLQMEEVLFYWELSSTICPQLAYKRSFRHP